MNPVDLGVDGRFARGRSRFAGLCLGVMAGLVLSAGASAMAADAAPVDPGTTKPAEPEAAAAAPEVKPASKIWTLNAGIDFTTDYYFRGIKRENQGLIAQPWLDISIGIWDRQGPAVIGPDADAGEGILDRVSWTVGTWNSLHSGPTGTQGDAPGQDVDSPRAWFESDLYTSINATFLKDWQASVIYTAYMFPNDALPTTQEVAFGLGYDDSKLLGAFSLKPNILFAVETAGGADLKSGELGSYFQVSIEPGFRLVDSRDYPIDVHFPMTLGLSLSDYYEDASGHDDTFGFFDVGVVFTMPLAFIPKGAGSWELKAGVHLVTVGSNAAELAGPAVTRGRGDSVDVVGVVGISMNY
jgi:hypothetical protein